MKVVITTYTFNAAAKTVDFSGYTNFDEQRLQAIVNITRGVVIYAPGISGKGLTSIAGDVLTLEYDTTGHANVDKLMPLYIEDALPLPTGAATQATLAAILADLQAKADLAETQPVSVQSLPAGLATSANQTSEIALLTSLAGEDFGTETTLAAILAKIIAAPATEARQVTAQTALDAIKTALELLDNAVAGNELQVDVLTVPADPFGTNADAAATAGSAGSMQAKLRLITSQLDSIKTAVELLDNAVAGNELQVDVITVPADPFGTNADAAATAGSTGSIQAKLRLMTSQLDSIKTAVELIDNMISGNYAQTKAFADTSGSGGLSISRTISAASTNATSAKGSAGKVFGIIATNINAAVRYLKLYNKASAPTVGTDTPVMTIAIPGNTAGAGIVINFADIGVNFATGIAYAITTGVADSDTGAVAANEIIVQVLYA